MPAQQLHPRQQSLWSAFAAPANHYPRLRHTEECEIAIVGAGIAGLSLAYHLASASLRPIVLEDSVIGSGASGAAAGIVAPQLTRHTPDTVKRILGSELGIRFLQLLAASGDYVFELIRSGRIACAAEQSGFLAPVRGARAAAKLAATVEQWRAYRDNIELLDMDRTRELSGCEGYAAALLDRSGGGLDPLALARGLGALAVREGAALFARSPALAVRRCGESWLLTTPAGAVRARRVVLCGNGGNATLQSSLSRTVLPLPVYQVATRPLDATTRAGILPHNHVLTDQEPDVFSIRYGYGRRLVTAYPAPPGASLESIETAVNRRLLIALPQFQWTPLEFVWHGTAWVNSKLLPRIVHVDDGLFAVQACNGRGIALSTIIGRELARWLVAPKDYRMGVPVERPKKVFAFALARHAPRLLIAAAMLKRGWRARVRRVRSGANH